ncbi:MAG: class I SAM-dependent methyltransferase [Candidatus Omnitrophota bacterium]
MDNSETMKAWADNWSPHSVSEVMSIFGYIRVKRLLTIFRELLPVEGKILEGGCGLGPWVIKLRELGYDVTGVDYDTASIGKIKEYDPIIPAYVADVNSMPFENNTFDAYMSLGVLEHFVEGPQEAIEEARRVMKSDGLFLITLPYLNLLLRVKRPYERLKRIGWVRGLLGKEQKVFYYERYFNVREICNYLEAGGFEVEEIKPIDHIFSFVSFSRIFRDKMSYDGENDLAVKAADIFGKILPWGIAGSMLIAARKK